MNNSNKIKLVRNWHTPLRIYLRSLKFLVAGKLSAVVPHAVPRNAFDRLRCFCCFVGHGRSGGTLVGALLNAHPNVVMSNELNAVRQLAFGLSESDLYRVIYLVSKRQADRGSVGGGGYSYAVSKQWQGKHEDLLVIGDRKAGTTAYEIVRNPAVLAILEQKIRVRKQFIHVIRNPFDNIATTYRKTLAGRRESELDHLLREIDNYFARCTAIELIESRFGTESVCHIPHERLVKNPVYELATVCQFLGVSQGSEYLQDCADIVRDTPSQTRRSINWPDKARDLVVARMQLFPWLRGYCFEEPTTH
jgi:hypothetical protein